MDSEFSILMYHALSVEPDAEKYVLTEKKFREHLDLVKLSGKQGVSLTQALLQNDQTSHSVVLSIDDGHKSNIEKALPILKEYGYTATFYITTNRIGSSDEWMDWEDIKTLIKNGMDIGTHGHTHVFLDEASDEVLEYELRRPLELAEQHLGFRPKHMSLPGGRYDKRVHSISANLGYETLATSQPGVVMPEESRQSSPCLFGRFVVHQGTSPQDLRSMIDCDQSYVRSLVLRYKAKWLLKKLLGNKLYYLVWRLRMNGAES